MMGIANLIVSDDDIDDISAIVQLSNSITYTMIDRLLGGKGDNNEEDRDFTQIEVSIMRGVVESVTNLLQEPWENYVNITPQLTKIETNARAVSNIGYDDAMAIAMLDVHINEAKAVIAVCIPALELDSVMQKYTTFTSKGGKKSDIAREEERRGSILSTLSQSSLNVTAVLGEASLDMFDVMNLQAGDIIPLDKGIDNNIELNIGGQAWFDGKLGIFNSKKAIKIENVLRGEII
jgi:flagellar motor switch protein FliM